MSSPQVIELRQIKQSSHPRKTALALALGGSLKTSSIRSLMWRAFLGGFPLPTEKSATFLDDCEVALHESRKQLTASIKSAISSANPTTQGKASQKKKSRFGDSSSEDDVVEVHDDPLMNNKSTYAKEFARQKQESLIDKDLGRLWSDDPFFDEGSVKSDLKRVLLDFVALGNDYKQGMHEIASLFYWVLAKEGKEARQDPLQEGHADYDDSEFLRFVFDPQALSIDTLWFLIRVLHKPGLGLFAWYSAGVPGSPASPSAAKAHADIGQSALFGAGAEGESENECIELANHIQRLSLSQADPALYKHLNKTLNVHPTSYLVRWLRLLFLREFSFSQTCLIWDAVFAEFAYFDIFGEAGHDVPYELRNSIVPQLCVAMLLYLSRDLVNAEYAIAVRRLMRYPPVEDSRPFVERAIQLKYNEGHLPQLLMLAIPPKAPLPKSVQMESAQTGGLSHSSSNTPAPAAPPPPPKETVVSLREKQLRMGMLLASVITRLEGKWFRDGPPPTADEQTKIEDDYLLAIAELKKARDVLLNHVAD